MIMSRPIGEYEVVLADAGLVRVHRSHMVNVDHIRRVRRGKTPIVELSNGAEVDVSESYREALFAFLQINGGRRHDRD
jgi:two-component system LytT family response regulator